LCKVAPALAVGCTVVLKPSEIAPFSAYLFSEVMDAAGAPAGVFNLVNGDGSGVGAAIASHPDIDLISFIGSTTAGIEVARAAAPTVKRVHQELGGKSPNIILDDADLERSVLSGVSLMMRNSGQSCNAPSRMLVPHRWMDDAIKIAAKAADSLTVGDPGGNAQIGPVVSQTQWSKVQDLIGKGIEEGATLDAGGLGRPDGLERGYYVKPTVFGRVTNEMTIARTEIFGPVLSILGYETEDDAIEIGNDTVFGLAAYVQSSDYERAHRVSSRLRAGQVTVNGAALDLSAPFGGYKQSGNGRERGERAFDEYLEVKAIIGYAP
jgi:aldehyde dehydrogenase (NAD+)